MNYQVYIDAYPMHIYVAVATATCIHIEIMPENALNAIECMYKQLHMAKLLLFTVITAGFIF